MTRLCCALALVRPRVSIAACSLALALVLIPGLLVPGCSGPGFPIVLPPEPPPAPSTLPRTTPENVLYNLRAIYDAADGSVTAVADTLEWGMMYGSLFHPDTFAFHFVEGDQPPDYPDAWWGLAEEVHSFNSLLRSKALGIADDILLTWSLSQSEPDIRSGGNPPRLLHPTWRHVYVFNICLDVIEGATDYRVPNGTADFYLAPDPANPALWVITEWYDHEPTGGYSPVRSSTRGTPLVPATTWGRLKYVFF